MPRLPSPRFMLPLLALTGSACGTVAGVPSLAPRAAEAIDPRLPIPDNAAALAPDPALTARLAAAAAGPPESESWIAAQQLLSAAIAERAAFTAALGDLDELIAGRIVAGQRLVPQELAAAERLAAELAALNRAQTGELDQAGRRLGR
jgi:hypothetical protein